jgi:hypothetical protein
LKTKFSMRDGKIVHHESEVDYDPHGISESREAEIRKMHADHPYCPTCEVLLQLDIERAAHNLDRLADKMKIKELEKNRDVAILQLKSFAQDVQEHFTEAQPQLDELSRFRAGKGRFG